VARERNKVQIPIKYPMIETVIESSQAMQLDKFAALIPFPNHLCLGAKPQAVLWHDKAKQQRHG